MPPHRSVEAGPGGGDGYMAEFQVEQLWRDAKVLQIDAGTDEIQVSQIARNLLSRT